MKISIKLLLHLECITVCIAHLKDLHSDFKRKFQDLLEMDYPIWFVNLENYEPGEEIFNLDKMLKLRARVNKEGVFSYILIKDLHPNVF